MFEYRSFGAGTYNYTLYVDGQHADTKGWKLLGKPSVMKWQYKKALELEFEAVETLVGTRTFSNRLYKSLLYI